MQAKISMADILKLTPQERLTLVEEIWDSIAAVPESSQLTEAQRRELVDGHDASVIAIIHAKRDPSSWLGRA